MPQRSNLFLTFILLLILVTAQLLVVLHSHHFDSEADFSECQLCLQAHNLSHTLPTSSTFVKLEQARLAIHGTGHACYIETANYRFFVRAPPTYLS